MFSTAPFSMASLQRNWQQPVSSLFQAVGQPLTATSASNPSRHDDDKLSEMEKGKGTPYIRIDVKPGTYVPTSATPRTSSHEQTTKDYLVIEVAPERTALTERAHISARPVYGDDNV